MNYLPIFSSQQMRIAEQNAFSAGEQPSKFMDEVARNISAYLLKTQNLTKVIVLVGKGNNGGDGTLVARLLRRKKIDVEIFYLFEPKDCSPLLKQHLEAFVQEGGLATYVKTAQDIKLTKNSLILDGLLGSGFSGKVEGLFRQVIELVNSFSENIFSMDIPSGLDGNTGSAETVAVKAKATFFLKYPKKGFFIGLGFEHVGELIFIDFSLEQRFFQGMQPFAYLVTKQNLQNLLPPIKRTRHKYQAGLVCGLCNQFQMSGAVDLACMAALRSGAGYVRFLYPKKLQQQFTNLSKDLVAIPFNSLQDIEHACKKANAFFIGPGYPTDESSYQLLKDILAHISLPLVLDGGALFHLAEKNMDIPKNAILTPHVGEMQRFFPIQFPMIEQDLQKCQQWVDEKEIILVLKGAPTYIFHPHQPLYINPFGHPAMAKMGSGDVLTGVIAAFLAQKLEPLQAAILGVGIHGIAGQIAAQDLGSYSVIASDLLESLSEAFLFLAHLQDESLM